MAQKTKKIRSIFFRQCDMCMLQKEFAREPKPMDFKQCDDCMFREEERLLKLRQEIEMEAALEEMYNREERYSIK